MKQTLSVIAVMASFIVGTYAMMLNRPVIGFLCFVVGLVWYAYLDRFITEKFLNDMEFRARE